MHVDYIQSKITKHLGQHIGWESEADWWNLTVTIMAQKQWLGLNKYLIWMNA